MFQPETDVEEALSRVVLYTFLLTPHLHNMAGIIETIVTEGAFLDTAWKLIRYCCVNYPHFLACKLSAIYAKMGFREAVRERAILILNAVLIDLDGDGTPLTGFKILEYGRHLFSLPVADAIRGDDRYMMLKEVISRLVPRMFSVPGVRDWPDLRSYVSSVLQISFRDSVWIFEMLLVPLPDEFLTALGNELWPPIREALIAPRSEEEWFAGFAGAHALSVQATMHAHNAGFAESVRLTLVKSVAHAVGLGMEVAVDAGVLNAEAYMRRNARAYDKRTYDFTSRFIGMIDGIHGVERFHETKRVIGRMVRALEEEYFRTNQRGT